MESPLRGRRSGGTGLAKGKGGQAGRGGKALRGSPFGVAHNRLRFAAGQKSSDGRKTLLSERGPSPRSGGGPRDQHAEGQAVLDLQHVDGAVAELVEVLEQLDHLILQREVAGVALRPGAVLAADLDLTDAARQRVQDGVAVED